MAKIYVSPSTQSNNAYAGGGNERDNMRAVRDLLVPMLEAAGHSVRTGNWTNDIASPVADANRWGADYYVALHTNATGRPGVTARGVSMHVYGFGGVSEKLARALAAEAAKLSPSRTSVRKDNFYEVRNTKMPAVLSENDFHDNRAGADWIRRNHRAIAIWHARGLCQLAGGGDKLERYLSGGSAPKPKPKPSAPKPPAPKPTPGTRLVKIDTDTLNVRSGPGTGHKVTTTVKRGQIYTIVATQGSWGQLKSGAGWIHLGHTKPHGSTPAPAPKPKADTVQITASALNVRSGPGAGYKVTTTVKRGEVYTITERKNGWGKLKSGAGWISLAHTKKH